MQSKLFDTGERFTVSVKPGKYLSGEVFFLHLARALRGQQIENGSEITVHPDGAVSINGVQVFKPAPPKTDKRKPKTQRKAS